MNEFSLFYNIKNQKNVSASEIKETDKNLHELEKSLLSLTKTITNQQKLKVLLMVITLNMKVKEIKSKICRRKNISMLLDDI